MAMPQGYDGTRDDQEAAEGPDDYKRTCIDFVADISNDYKAWVDYYKLPADEDARRRDGIDRTVERACDWIAKVATTIKSIDVVMNDGIQKMAEATAGRPFQIGVFVNGRSSYATAKPGVIDVLVRASPREGRRARLGFHFKDDRFRIESTCGASLEMPEDPDSEQEELELHMRLLAENAVQRDVVSFTITVVEVQDGAETDKRGVTTAVHIT